MDLDELVDHWTLLEDERELIAGKRGPRTPAQRKARQLAKYLRGERPDYAYLKEVFRHLHLAQDPGHR